MLEGMTEKERELYKPEFISLIQRMIESLGSTTVPNEILYEVLGITKPSSLLDRLPPLPDCSRYKLLDLCIQNRLDMLPYGRDLGNTTFVRYKGGPSLDYDLRICREMDEKLRSYDLNHGGSIDPQIPQQNKADVRTPMAPHEGQRGKHQGTGEPLEYRNGRWQPIDRPKMVEYELGKWRTEDVLVYNSHQWKPLSALVCLIHDKYIDLNTTTGTATQLRDFKTGRDLEKPERMYPVWKGSYLCLQAELPSSDTETKLVRIRVKIHRLVYSQVHGGIPHGKEIHHRDGNPENNGISNLVALTPEEHRKVGKQTGVHKQARERISRDDPVVAEIKQLHADGLSTRKIEKQTGLSRETCRLIALDKYRFRESTE
jgi:hypothetical protein